MFCELERIREVVVVIVYFRILY